MKRLALLVVAALGVAGYGYHLADEERRALEGVSRQVEARLAELRAVASRLPEAQSQAAALRVESSLHVTDLGRRLGQAALGHVLSQSEADGVPRVTLGGPGGVGEAFNALTTMGQALPHACLERLATESSEWRAQISAPRVECAVHTPAPPSLPEAAPVSLPEGHLLREKIAKDAAELESLSRTVGDAAALGCLRHEVEERPCLALGRAAELLRGAASSRQLESFVLTPGAPGAFALEGGTTPSASLGSILGSVPSTFEVTSSSQNGARVRIEGHRRAASP